MTASNVRFAMIALWASAVGACAHESVDRAPPPQVVAPPISARSDAPSPPSPQASPPAATELPSSPAPATEARTSDASADELLADLTRWDAATQSARRAAAEQVARRLPDFALRRLETFACGGQTHEVAIYEHEKTGMEFVLVPAATFEMGVPFDEWPKRRVGDQIPHAVALTRPFLIARTECTQEAYERIVGTNPAHFQGARHPVDTVSWEEATAFCGRMGLSLPTEAQWEWACRAGTSTRYCFGDSDDALDDYGWHQANSAKTTHDAALKTANAFGLFDMHGNVWEWCADWSAPYPPGRASDPAGPAAGSARVVRGGCFQAKGPFACSAHRYDWFPDDHGLTGYIPVGFRPAKTVPME